MPIESVKAGELITSTEAALMMGISPSTLEDYQALGVRSKYPIPQRTDSLKDALMYRSRDVQNWVEGQYLSQKEKPYRLKQQTQYRLPRDSSDLAAILPHEKAQLFIRGAFTPGSPTFYDKARPEHYEIYTPFSDDSDADLA